ncbi:MAG: hypothetical protein AB7T63_15400 [Planctomycetota bacterium]
MAERAPLSVERRNAAAYAVSELGWGFAWSLVFEAPMIAAFAAGIGRGEGDAGLIWLLQSLGIALPMLVTAWLLKPFGRMRGLVAWGHATAAVLLLGLAGVAAWAEAGTLRLVYLLTVPVFFLAIGVQIPAWYAMVGQLFPPGAQHRLLGVVFAVNRIGALVGGGLAGYVIETAASPGEAWSRLFAISGASGLLACWPYRWIQERGIRPRPRPPLRSHLAGMGRTWRRIAAFRRFVLADALGIAQWVVIALFAEAAFSRDGHPRWLAGPWTQASAVGMLLAAVLVTLTGNRVRPRAWVAVGMAALAVGGVVAAIGGGTWHYGFVAATVGFSLGTRMTCLGLSLMRIVPARQRTQALGLQGAVATALQGTFAWGGGLVAIELGYGPVFAGAAVVVVVALMLLMTWVPRPVSSDGMQS